MFAPLVNVAMSYVEQMVPNLSEEHMDALRTAFKQVICGGPREDLITLLLDQVGTIDPLSRIVVVLEVPGAPLRAPPAGNAIFRGFRRKPRSWSSEEDIRLLAGIHRHGLDSWASVAHFVGGGRLRAHCAQRWSRGLDPDIIKSQWSTELSKSFCSLSRNRGPSDGPTLHVQ
jgi:hypothetical protein